MAHDDIARPMDGTAGSTRIEPDRKPSSLLRKVVVGLVGAIVILIGIPLIPLVGPGWLIVFTGLAILAREFAWAGRLRDRIRERFRSFFAGQPE